MEHNRKLLRQHPADPIVRSDLAYACWITANIARSTGEFGKAGDHYRDAVGLLTRLNDRASVTDIDRLLLANARLDLGESLRMAGSPSEAETWYLQALDLLTGPGVPSGDERYPRTQASALIDLAGCQVATGRAMKARSHASKAIEILRPLAERPRSKDKDRLLLVYALASRSDALGACGEQGPSRSDLEEALKIAEELARQSSEVANTDHRYALTKIQIGLGRLLSKAGDLAGAAVQFDTAYAGLAVLWRENLRMPFMEADMAEALNGRAEATLVLLAAMPDASALKRAEEDCINARSSLLGIVHRWPDHYDYRRLLGQTIAALGRIALVRGERERAEHLLNESLEHHGRARGLNPLDPKVLASEAATKRTLETLKNHPVGDAMDPRRRLP